jgi:hypothetical protein
MQLTRPSQRTERKVREKDGAPGWAAPNGWATPPTKQGQSPDPNAEEHDVRMGHPPELWFGSALALPED